MNNRYQDLDIPAAETCLWIFKNDEYRDWIGRDHRSKNGGLIWLKGKPGSCKSVLMKEVFRQATLTQDYFNYRTAAFFFNAKGDRTWSGSHVEWEKGGEGSYQFQERELRDAVRLILSLSYSKGTVIFLDALDECDEGRIRDEVYFWLDITRHDGGFTAPVGVCMSSRHFPTIAILDSPTIVMEHNNNIDIDRFVTHRLSLGIPAGESHSKLRWAILRKSEGVFLWVALVVDDVLRKWDEGKGINFLLDHLANVPRELEELFREILSFPSLEEKQLAVRLLQWAILTTKPLRLKEWHHILAFIRRPLPSSLREWSASEYFTEDDDQLEKQIRKASRGLVEVRTRVREAADDALETVSIRAGAGSLSLNTGETRVVQVIHESVRDFFLTKEVMSKRNVSNADFECRGHILIMTTCLNYLGVPELDALVHARLEAEGHHNFPRPDEQLSPSSGSLRKSSDTVENMASNQQHAGPMVGASVFEAFRSSSDPTSRIDVIRWLRGSHIAMNEPPQSASPSSSIQNVSSCRSMAQSQTLEAYPALLSYATCGLFAHAQQAEMNGADPSPIIQRLSQLVAWNRWVVLREDVPLGTTLLEYAKHQELHSWTKWLCVSGQPPPVGGRRPRKLVSVASFSSASSHTESSSSSRAEIPRE